MTKIVSEGKIKKFFEDALFFDKQYFNELFKTYQKDFAYLYGEFLRLGNTIEIAPLTISNEIGDFLDGNGFMFEFNFGSTRITRILESAKTIEPTDGADIAPASCVTVDPTVINITAPDGSSYSFTPSDITISTYDPNYYYNGSITTAKSIYDPTITTYSITNNTITGTTSTAIKGAINGTL